MLVGCERKAPQRSRIDSKVSWVWYINLVTPFVSTEQKFQIHTIYSSLYLYLPIYGIVYTSISLAM